VAGALGQPLAHHRGQELARLTDPVDLGDDGPAAAAVAGRGGTPAPPPRWWARDGGVAPGSRRGSVGIIWTIVIGFVAGVIAKLIMPGRNEPQGFVLTTILGIVGAVVASYLGQAIGWYRPGEGAGLLGAIVGSVIVLAAWGAVAGRRAGRA
jgi:uncharacterized membrane protein YeaQ/YmgE (transglycosylase-associated protein family)